MPWTTTWTQLPYDVLDTPLQTVARPNIQWCRINLQLSYDLVSQADWTGSKYDNYVQIRTITISQSKLFCHNSVI